MEAAPADRRDPPPAPHAAPGPARPGATIWSLRKSRARWKRKYQALKATLKRHQNRVADVTKSRARWRLRAEDDHRRRAALEAENAALRERVATLEREKKIPAPTARP
jgi:hypothetical protein